MLIKASLNDLQTVSEMATELWPKYSFDQMQKKYRKLLLNKDLAVFLYMIGDKYAGFAQCQLRYDYIEGSVDSPIGYLEGLYIKEKYRHRGIGGQLLKASEDWAKSRGCKEFASDCDLVNDKSLIFHKSAGFAETNRIICFTKIIA